MPPGRTELASVACGRALAVVLALIVVFTLLFRLWPGLDLTVARLFHDPATGMILAGQPVWQGVLMLEKLAAGGFAVAALGLLPLSLWRRGGRDVLAARFWGLVILLYGLGLGVLVNGLMKRGFGRPRPAQIEAFGGDAPFIPAWQVSDYCHSACSFVSAEVGAAAILSFGLMLGALWFAARPGARLWRGLSWLSFVLLVLTAIERIGSGRHFLSDVIFAALLIVALGLGLACLLRPRADAFPSSLEFPPMTSPPATSSRSLGLSALALALGLALVLPLLRPVLPVDETRYLTVAWEMHHDGTFIVPHLNGEIYGHKPPLLFWLINLVWSVTGVSEVAARLVAPAFGVLAVALTWGLGNRLFPERPGLGARAALILASTGVFAIFATLTMFDTMLTVATLLGLLALLQLDRGGRWPAVLGLGAALAFGVLAKGPVILVHLMPLALARPLWAAPESPVRAGGWYRRIASSIGVALLLLAAWLLPALWLGGADYRAEILWRQSAGRMVNAFDHARPVWFFVAALPVLLWPWAWRLPTLGGLFHAGTWADPRARLLAIWGLSTLLLFSLISGKQVHYLLPALPAAALALAAAPAPRRGWGALAACGIVIVPVLIWAGLLAAGRARIDGGAVTALGPLTLLLATAVALLGLGAIHLAARREPDLAWALVAPVALLTLHLALRPALFEHFDSASFATELSRAPEAGVAIVGYPYQGEFGFTARLTAPIQVLAQDDVTGWVAGHPGGLILSARDALETGTEVGEAWLAGHELRAYRLP